MTPDHQSIEGALRYLEDSALRLGLANIDPDRPLEDQKTIVLKDMGRVLARTKGQAQLEPYRVFWNVFDLAARLQGETGAAQDAPVTPDPCQAPARQG